MFIVKIQTLFSLAVATTRIPIHWSENFDAMIDVTVSSYMNPVPHHERVELNFQRFNGIHLLSTPEAPQIVQIGGVTFQSAWSDQLYTNNEQNAVSSLSVGLGSDFFHTVGSYMITPTEIIINPEMPELECTDGSPLEPIALSAMVTCKETMFANNGMNFVALSGKHEFFMSRTEYPAFMNQVREGLAEAGLTIGEDGRTINGCNIDSLNELLPVLLFRPVKDMDNHPIRRRLDDPVVEIEPRNYLRPTPGQSNTCTLAVRTRSGNMPYTLGSAIFRKYALVLDSRSSGRICVSRSAL
jgi:hypothetical protein